MHLFAALRTFDRNRVDIRAVQFDVVRAVVGHFFQFRNTADGMHMSALALPDIERGSPVTVAADAPVLDILDPVAEASLADTLRDPVDGVVVGDQVIPYRRHFNEPGFTRIVDERRVASPAVGVAVLELRRVEEQSSCVQVF